PRCKPVEPGRPHTVESREVHSLAPGDKCAFDVGRDKGSYALLATAQVASSPNRYIKSVSAGGLNFFTISTFSCDIAYSDRPRASRASRTGLGARLMGRSARARPLKGPGPGARPPCGSIRESK